MVIEAVTITALKTSWQAYVVDELGRLEVCRTILSRRMAELNSDILI